VFKQASVGTPLLEHSFWRDVALSKDRLFPERWIPVVSWKSAAAIDLNPRQLFEQSYKAVKLADRWCREYPIFANLLHNILGDEGLAPYKTAWEKQANLAKQLGIRVSAPKTLSERLMDRLPKKTATVKDAHVSVLEVDRIPEHQFRFMSTALIDRIHRDGYYVTDTRDQTKLASVTGNNNDRGLANPVGPGLYKVFMADGTFRDCFVLYRYHPMTPSEEDARWLVLDKETTKTCHANLSDIWTASRSDDTNWFDKLPAGNAHVHENGDGEYERHKGITSYLMTPSGYVWEGRLLEEGDGSFYDEYDSVPISLTSNTLKEFREIGSGDGRRPTLIIGPKDAILRRYKSEESGHRLALGCRSLWTTMLIEGALPITVRKQQKAFAEYAIDNEELRPKSAALERLMVKHELSRETAEMLLKEADLAGPRGITRIREKTAFSGPVPQDRFAVTFPKKDRGLHGVTGLDIEQDLDTAEPIEALRPTKIPDDREMWPGLLDSETNTSGGPPTPNQYDMDLAAQASRSGQKDFVSSQMLLSLLREIDNDDIIAKYVNTFEKACDTLGRLYMQVLWRTDAFEERFGRTQLKEFKEMLVALFLQMGDFICYLRQRDIRPSPVLSLGSTNIEEG
jgi:hypothetical protein